MRRADTPGGSGWAIVAVDWRDIGRKSLTTLQGHRRPWSKARPRSSNTSHQGETLGKHTLDLLCLPDRAQTMGSQSRLRNGHEGKRSTSEPARTTVLPVLVCFWSRYFRQITESAVGAQTWLRCAMKVSVFLFAPLLLAPAFVLSQNEPSASTQGNMHHFDRHHVSITGCLTSREPNEYEMVDQQGITNLLYSRINLSAYVGQSVTVVGDQSATPSTDSGTARPMPHFIVKKVHASGKCK